MGVIVIIVVGTGDEQATKGNKTKQNKYVACWHTENNNNKKNKNNGDMGYGIWDMGYGIWDM